MKCNFCESEIIEKKIKCPVYDKHKINNYIFCKNTEKVTVTQCTNPNCEPPNHNLEPWDDKEEEHG